MSLFYPGTVITFHPPSAFPSLDFMALYKLWYCIVLW